MRARLSVLELRRGAYEIQGTMRIHKDPEVDEIKRRSLVDRDGTPRMPKAPKGYYVDPESIEVGINPITHYAYRHYTLIKIKKRE